jgi:hypothetical protein
LSRERLQLSVIGQLADAREFAVIVPARRLDVTRRERWCLDDDGVGNTAAPCCVHHAAQDPHLAWDRPGRGMEAVHEQQYPHEPLVAPATARANRHLAARDRLHGLRRKEEPVFAPGVLGCAWSACLLG